MDNIPQLPDKMTYGEAYGTAMNITDQEEANRYFEALVQRHLRVYPKYTREDAEQIERGNLGYYAGYYDSETRERVQRLFLAVHHIFGPTEQDNSGESDGQKASEAQ